MRKSILRDSGNKDRRKEYNSEKYQFRKNNENARKNQLDSYERFISLTSNQENAI